MYEENAPFKDGYDESSEVNEERSENMQEILKERRKVFNSMSKYEKKLMRGLMRGFGNTMILWLISQKRQHGYEIMTLLQESSPYENKMPSASKIYPVLHDLEKHRLIEGSWEHQGKRKIKYYEITEEGQETLSRFREMAKVAKENRSSLWLDFFRDMLMDKGI
jgi:PadR family transcriptional regulator, regulatory protein PadR